jgi:hypothetical protein
MRPLALEACLDVRLSRTMPRKAPSEELPQRSAMWVHSPRSFRIEINGSVDTLGSRLDGIDRLDIVEGWRVPGQ